MPDPVSDWEPTFERMRVLDLFSGIGGFALGLERAGFETVGFCEIDPFCRAVLAKHWPDIECHDDIRTFDATEFVRRCGRPDVVCGGFPCQQVSCAGRGEGLGTEQSPTDRSGLWFEMLRIVREVRPRWVLAENVGGLRLRGGDEVLAGLEREGYAVWPLVVGAWAVGAPHRRNRVWIVANLARGDEREQRAERLRVGVRGEHADACKLFRWELAIQGRLHTEHYNCICGESKRMADAERKRQQGDGWPKSTRRIHDGKSRGPSAEGVGLSIADPSSMGDAASRGTAAAEQSGRLRGAVEASDPMANGTSIGRPREGNVVGGLVADTRWPARPGEPQHEWESPRLVEFQVGQSVDGLSAGLAGHIGRITGWDSARVAQWWQKNKVKVDRARNRQALRALGNSVVPACVELIGRAIMEAERCPTTT